MGLPSFPPPPVATPLAGGDGTATQPWAKWLAHLATIIDRVKLGAGGPAVVQGVGVPAAELPNGSLYLRSDGTGPNLYVRENAAWVAK